MMHCTMEDLLALQAGEGTTWARRHLVWGSWVGGPEGGRRRGRAARVAPRRARGPPARRWPAVRAAALAERRRRRNRWGLWSLAAAAAVAGLIVLRPIWTNRLDAAEVARGKRQGATLGQELGGSDPHARGTTGRSAALAAALEDRIALIDGELTRLGPQTPARPAALVKLWQQRVDLMQQLMSVRVSRASYVGL